ncbi:lipase family protein [Nocardia salmonicida]|uniref:lipase family protein n=1 Tax=Nocardia salmonicida TaxID=53431 RepID=UPI00366D25B9
MKTTRPIASMMTAIATLSLTFATPAVLSTQAHASPDSFYQYTGNTPLEAFEPGAILNTRVLPYHVAGGQTAVTAVQLLYRTNDAQHRPSVNVTSVLKPAGGTDPTKAVAYQSYYDSLNPEDSPSRSIAGDVSFGGLIVASEASSIDTLLGQGYTVIISDTQGQQANFAAGPEYGMNTLDSIRAATRSPDTQLNADTRIGLMGYSGGAIATNWAAALAPRYAPEVNAQLIGAAEGGVLVKPSRNLRYVDGSTGWSGVAAMAIIGIARAYDLDLSPYLSAYGAQLLATINNASIANVVFQYPGLTWRQIVKPEYADPDSIVPLSNAVEKTNLGIAPTPTIPMFIAQGAHGELEGTDGTRPAIGPGDGVMIAGDVRSLARQYCDTGNPSIRYQQHDALSHTTAQAVWTLDAFEWLNNRFAGIPAPTTCGAIAPGNPLTS